MQFFCEVCTNSRADIANYFSSDYALFGSVMSKYKNHFCREYMAAYLH